MTDGDFQFMKEIGIEPSGLDDPFPGPLPPPPPTEAPIPRLTEEDSRWLQDLRVAWEHEPQPGFVPPGTLPEYLARYPNGIRQAVGEVSQELGLALPDGGLDDLAQGIVQMFLDFAAADLEDVVAMYVTFRPIRPREDRSEHFHSYVKMRVRAALPILIGNMGADECE